MPLLRNQVCVFDDSSCVFKQSSFRFVEFKYQVFRFVEFKFAFCGIQVLSTELSLRFVEFKFAFGGIKFAFCGIQVCV